MNHSKLLLRFHTTIWIPYCVMAPQTPGPQASGIIPEACGPQNLSALTTMMVVNADKFCSWTTPEGPLEKAFIEGMRGILRYVSHDDVDHAPKTFLDGSLDNYSPSKLFHYNIFYRTDYIRKLKRSMVQIGITLTTFSEFLNVLKLKMRIRFHPRYTTDLTTRGTKCSYSIYQRASKIGRYSPSLKATPCQSDPNFGTSERRTLNSDSNFTKVTKCDQNTKEPIVHHFIWTAPQP